MGPLHKCSTNWFLQLHLQAAPHRVEGVSRACANSDCRLGRAERGKRTQNAFVLLEGVEAGSGVEGAQLE